MTGAYRARSTRGKYNLAGYVQGAERDMYIASVPAGSAQDRLRDTNRAGYRSERPWSEAPAPVFEQERPVRKAAPRTRTKNKPFLDRLAEQARRERTDVLICCVLGAIILMMLAVSGRQAVRGVEIQQSIRMYQNNTLALERENEKLSQALELASSGELIRNKAQNELGMLRPERAITETIYIRTPEHTAQKAAQNIEEPRMELLDMMLGLLNVLHIGE